MARPAGTLHTYLGTRPPAAPIRRRRTVYPAHEVTALVESYVGSKESPVPGFGTVDLHALVEELLCVRGITLRRLWNLVVAHRTTKNVALDLYRLAENPYLAAKESPPAIPFGVCRALEDRFGFQVKPSDVAAALVVDRVHELVGSGTDPYVSASRLECEIASRRAEYGEAMEVALRQEIVGRKIDGVVMCTTRSMHLAMRGIETIVRAMCEESMDTCDDVEWGDKFVDACGNKTFNDGQRTALRGAYNRPLMVITGGPGTGKTTVVAAINAVFAQQGTTVVNLAFCGKAVKEMRRRVPDAGSRCFTLHRFLRHVAAESDDLDLESAVIVCDEASMVDVMLFWELLRHVEKTQSRLVLVGDPNQLAPVGLGTPFNDMVAMREELVLPHIHLTEANRHAADMARFVDGIRAGKWDPPECVTFTELPVVGRDRTPDTDELSRKVAAPMREYITEHALAGDLADTLYLTPQREYAFGTQVLGEVLQSVYNAGERGNELDTGRYGDRFLEGDAVVRTANSYGKKQDRYHGDTGIVNAAGRGRVTVTYDDGGEPEALSVRRFREEFALGYVRTIHKSQGGEAKNVVLVGPTSCHAMWSMPGARTLLLVAVSRAKERVHILGHRRSLERCLRTTSPKRVGRLFGAE